MFGWVRSMWTDKSNNSTNPEQRRLARKRIVRKPRFNSQAEQLEDRKLLTAVSFIVTNTDDSGEGSLRDAIAQANSVPGPNVIEFSSLFTDGTPDTIILTSGELFINDSVELIGPGSANVTVSGNNASRVFNLRDDFNALNEITISGLTISSGSASHGAGIIIGDGIITIEDSIISGNHTTNDGGGIYADGFSMTLTLRNLQITGNSSSRDGGGVYIEDTGGLLLIEDSTISGNTAGDDGGGIYFYDPDREVVIRGTTISGNTAEDNGGGILLYDTDGGTFVIENSTISGNHAGGDGGGLHFYEPDDAVIIRNSTIANNSADGQGGGIYLDSADDTFEIISTVIAGNTAGGEDDPSDFDGSSYEVSQITNSLIFAPIGESLLGANITGTLITGVDPLLSSLADNGGLTQTHALQTGSPAIDTGANPESLTTDQRGTGFLRSFGAGVDMGAFEVQTAVVNTAPTDIILTNTTTSIRENVSTATRTKMADISVTDDGNGTNTLSLTGADASSFEIDGNVLYLKAGVALDFETKISYTVIINVDDSTVGSTPDATESFTLNITDFNESPIQIMDETDAGFSLTGSWKNKTVLGQVGYKGNLYYASPTTTNYTGTAYHNGAVVGRAGQAEFATADVDTATWTFTDLPDGIYRVSATWRQATNRATNALFTVDDGSDGNAPATKVVNQQLIPNSLNDGGYGWQDLAVAYGQVTSGILTVTLTSAGATGGGGATGYGGPFTFVVADAVRIERLSSGPTLDAAGGASSDQTAATLTQAELQTVANAAIARWQGAAITAEQKALLTGLSFSIQNLTGGTLGVQVGESILIDVNGAGYGWFVDTTPNSDSEFTLDASGNQMTATSGAAAGKMDLLTVVLHEIGHRLGLDDDLSSDGLMSDTLTTGTRRVPVKAAAETQTTQTAKQRRVERVALRRAARGR